MALQTAIIFLGKIFDEKDVAHSVSKLLNAARREIEHFNKNNLRDRKIQSGGNFDGLDEYLDNSHELSLEDLRIMKSEVRRAHGIWKRIKPLRDKVFAHHEDLPYEEKSGLYKNVTYTDITTALQILLNVSHAFWQAEYNGREPDFLSDHEVPIQRAKKQTEALIKSLLHS